MRALAITVVVALLGAAAPAGAWAEEIPPYDGTMSFPAIHGPADPEEFSWEVKFGEDEELRAIDERHAGVYWSDETLAMTIEAVAAHDANGIDVPTTLAVTQPNVITLTVHHRAGNPAAGGAPFLYPIVAGVGWEGGFQTHVVATPPPEAMPGKQASCRVPRLLHRSLREVRKILRKYGCKLGEVRGERSRGAWVVKQYPRRGRVLPAGGEVDVKVAPPRDRGRRLMPLS